MTAKTDSLGTKYYTYDSINRLTKITYSGETVYFDYDNADNRIGMTSPSADIDYAYDVANSLTQKTESIEGRTYSTRYDYDANKY